MERERESTSDSGSSEEDLFESILEENPEIEMPYTFRKGDLPTLDLDHDDAPAFLRWEEMWNAYQDVSGLSGEQNDRQVKVLKMCFQGETLTIVNHLGIPEGDRGNPASIVEALKAHVEGQVNKRAERHKFHQRKQHQGESIADFVVSLRTLAATCQFPTEEIKEDLIVDQMIEGCQDQEVVKELLKRKDANLKDALELAQGIEASKYNRSEIRGNTEEATANTFKRKEIKSRRGQSPRDLSLSGQSQRGQRQRGQREPEELEAEECSRCGLQHDNRRCPATNEKCANCGKKGHFARKCRTRVRTSNVVETIINSVRFNTDDPPRPKTKVRSRWKKSTKDECQGKVQKYLHQCKYQASLKPDRMQVCQSQPREKAHGDQDLKGGMQNRFQNTRKCSKKIPNTLKMEMQERRPQNPKVSLTKKPERPFQEITLDFCQKNGLKFLIAVDHMTNWPEVWHLPGGTNADKLTNTVRDLFRRTATPDVLWCGQGAQFKSRKFQKFLRHRGVKHKKSSLRNPNTRGEAIKNLINTTITERTLDADKLGRALLKYRNKPSSKDSLSPAQKLLGHQMQDRVPVHRRAFAKAHQHAIKQVEKSQRRHKAKAAEKYNQCAVDLPKLRPGQSVAVFNPDTKHWDIKGTVVHNIKHRKYLIKTNSGWQLTRHRRLLRAQKLLFLPRRGGGDGSPPVTPRPEFNSIAKANSRAGTQKIQEREEDK